MTPGDRLDPIALGLPHREPFIFIDSVVERVHGNYAIGEKTFSTEDAIFKGHFPGNPIVPGVLLVEALAQTAGIAVGESGTPLYLAAIKNMKFPSACVPDETIRLTAQRNGMVGGLVQCNVVARVGERVVAEGMIVLGSVG